MEMEYTENTTCCVTHHLVDEVARDNPSLLLDEKGYVKLYDTLFFLGFKVDYGMLNHNVSVHPDTLIRSSINKKQCYKTKVYKGWVRNAVKTVVNGEIVFDKYKFHHLVDEYSKYEVLQPKCLNKYVAEEELMSVFDFGNARSILG